MKEPRKLAGWSVKDVRLVEFVDGREKIYIDFVGEDGKMVTIFIGLQEAANMAQEILKVLGAETPRTAGE